MKTKILFFVYLFSFIFVLNAQWPTTPNSALHVGYGIYPMLTVDPNDESITVVYLIDERIEAKKYDRYGYPMWGGNAIALVDTPGTSYVRHLAYPGGQWGQIISDDSGGAVVCWEDYRNAPLHPITFEPEGSEVFLQRVDVNGQVRYGTNGKKISGPATAGFRLIGDMKSDYNGGFVVGYMGDSSSTSGLLKRFLLNGILDWYKYFANGSLIDVDATDIFGNIFVSYGGSGQPHSRMKLDLQGNFLWPDTLNGKIPGHISYRWGGAFSDKNKGAIGVGPGYLKINRVDSTGQFVFGNNGINLGEGQLGLIGYAPDSFGGIYVSWTKDGSRIQRIKKDGTVAYLPRGIIVAHDSLTVGSHRIVSDKESGIISIWADVRNWPKRSFYVQKIDSTGNLLWDSTGLEFLTSDYDLFFTGSAVPFHSDGRGGAIYLACDGPGIRIIMQQISKNGIIGEVDTSAQIIISKPKLIEKYILEQNYPNPFNSSTQIRYYISVKANVQIVVYNIKGQKVKSIIDKKVTKGFHTLNWDGRNEQGLKVSSGLYIYRMILKNQSFSKKLLLIN